MSFGYWRWNGEKSLIRAVLLASIIVSLIACSNEEISNETDLIPQRLRQSVTPVSERVYQEIVVDGKNLKVELADTPEKITLGLSYRDEIGSKTSSGSVDGMLFVMPQRVVPTFWMKGMLMDLDMVWIDCRPEADQSWIDHSSKADKFVRDELIGKTITIEDQECVVVDVTRNVPAPAEPLNLQSLPTYSPQFPVTHVLEIEAL